MEIVAVDMSHCGIGKGSALSKNDKVFNDKDTSLLQVLYRSTSLLRSWPTLQRVENRDLFMVASARLDLTARDIFIRHGWPRDLRQISLEEDYIHHSNKYNNKIHKYKQPD